MSLFRVVHEVSTNEDWRDAIALVLGEGEDSEPMDLTGASFEAHLRSVPETSLVTLSASLENGFIEVSEPATEGVIAWAVPAEVMRTVTPGAYVYDLLWTDPTGEVTTLIEGVVTVKLGVTRP